MPDTRTARIDLSDAGVVIVRIQNGARQVVDRREREPLDGDHNACTRNLADAFTALGLLIDTSPLGRTMGNVNLGLARLPMPMKMFVEESLALERRRKGPPLLWLRRRRRRCRRRTG
jgi:hypothetical protein